MYDVTLNFQDKQTPTLLGIVNGKKYKADMSVRSVGLFLGVLILRVMNGAWSRVELTQLGMLPSSYRLLFLCWNSAAVKAHV